MTLQSISKKENIFDQEETTTLALKLPTVLKRTFEQKKTRIQQ